MITPIDVICLQMIHATNKVESAHYHLEYPPMAKPNHIMDEANFHLINRSIQYDQIGFDYYDNIVVYRV